MEYDEIEKQLSATGANLRCLSLKALLINAGFKVRRTQGNHYVFTHDSLEGFTAGSFNGGHGGKNPQVLKSYIKKTLKIVKQYKDELETYLERKNG